MATDSSPGAARGEARADTNDHLLNNLTQIVDNGVKEVLRLRRNLSFSYYLLITLSTAMFAAGLTLLMVPVVLGFTGASNTDLSISGISGGLGAADLAALFFLQPVRRIKKLMGDMSQLTLAINSYQTQVGLRLLEADSDNPVTVSQAADHVGRASRESMELIEKYFGEPLST